MNLSATPTVRELRALEVMMPGWKLSLNNGTLRGIWCTQEGTELVTFLLVSPNGYARAGAFLLELAGALGTARRELTVEQEELADWVGKLGDEPVGELLARFYPNGDLTIRVEKVHTLNLLDWLGG